MLAEQAEGFASLALLLDAEVEPLAAALGTLRSDAVECVHQFGLGAAACEQVGKHSRNYC